MVNCWQSYNGVTCFHWSINNTRVIDVTCVKKGTKWQRKQFRVLPMFLKLNTPSESYSYDNINSS